MANGGRFVAVLFVIVPVLDGTVVVVVMSIKDMM